MKTIEYYTYSTPKVRIRWNGRLQAGIYYSAVEAEKAINAQRNQFFFSSDIWEIVTPDVNIRVH